MSSAQYNISATAILLPGWKSLYSSLDLADTRLAGVNAADKDGLWLRGTILNLWDDFPQITTFSSVSFSLSDHTRRNECIRSGRKSIANQPNIKF